MDRIRLAGVRRGLICLLAGGALLLGFGCGDDDESPAPDQEAAAPSESTDPNPDTASKPREPAAIGEGVEVKGPFENPPETDGIELKVTPTGLADPAPNPVAPAEDNKPGTRWVRVDITIVNRGDQYGIASGAFTLITDRGLSVPPNPAAAPWQVLAGTLVTGDTRRGSLGFLVPKGSGVSELRFEPFTGGSEVLRWET